MLYVRFPLSLQPVGDRLHEHGIDISYEIVRACRNQFSALFASKSRRIAQRMCSPRRAGYSYGNGMKYSCPSMKILTTRWRNMQYTSAEIDAAHAQSKKPHHVADP
jgi:hypothetical protein